MNSLSHDFTILLKWLYNNFMVLKDTHREKAPSNKTSALRKSTNMGV